MRLAKRIPCAASFVAWLGMALPQGLATAAVPADAPSTGTPPRIQVVRDVALDDDGSALGTVVDLQGRGMAGESVSVHQHGQLVARTQTNEHGRFRIQGLRGGTYQVAAANDVCVCRFWAPRTAPPSAQPGVLLVADGSLARGQHPLHELADPTLTFFVILAAIAIPIVVHNSGNKPPASGD
jgi:hypothetical protein